MEITDHSPFIRKPDGTVDGKPGLLLVIDLLTILRKQAKGQQAGQPEKDPVMEQGPEPSVMHALCFL
jgi:hypothetical protein